jgi:hypothetical protein
MIREIVLEAGISHKTVQGVALMDATRDGPAPAKSSDQIFTVSVAVFLRVSSI